jgi:hypothetical protein
MRDPMPVFIADPVVCDLVFKVDFIAHGLAYTTLWRFTKLFLYDKNILSASETMKRFRADAFIKMQTERNTMSKLRQSQRRANRPKKTKKKKSFRLRDLYNAIPSMIHEQDYLPTDCVLCGKEMKNVHDTHDARPLTPSQTAKSANATGNIGRCCSDCNTLRVIPARIMNQFAAA